MGQLGLGEPRRAGSKGSAQNGPARFSDIAFVTAGGAVRAYAGPSLQTAGLVLSSARQANSKAPDCYVCTMQRSTPPGAGTRIFSHFGNKSSCHSSVGALSNRNDMLISTTKPIFGPRTLTEERCLTQGLVSWNRAISSRGGASRV
jgi:hypothetical protein